MRDDESPKLDLDATFNMLKRNLGPQNSSYGNEFVHDATFDGIQLREGNEDDDSELQEALAAAAKARAVREASGVAVLDGGTGESTTRRDSLGYQAVREKKNQHGDTLRQVRTVRASAQMQTMNRLSGSSRSKH
jgi:hypothetical protein